MYVEHAHGRRALQNARAHVYKKKILHAGGERHADVDKATEDERDEMDVVSAADGVPDVRTVVVEHWHAHLKGGAML